MQLLDLTSIVFHRHQLHLNKNTSSIAKYFFLSRLNGTILFVSNYTINMINCIGLVVHLIIANDSQICFTLILLQLPSHHITLIGIFVNMIRNSIWCVWQYVHNTRCRYAWQMKWMRLLWFLSVIMAQSVNLVIYFDITLIESDVLWIHAIAPHNAEKKKKLCESIQNRNDTH